jgi:glycine cleavage system aminomethyltransferase T
MPEFFPNVRRSPYFEATGAAGAVAYMVYNHMYMPISYGRDPREEYLALTERATLWDVGAERQTELRGPDAVRLADYLCTRDLSQLSVGTCKFTTVCDDHGRIMTEPIVLAPEPNVVWISHGDVDLTLWATAIATHAKFDVEVSEPDVAPLQVQGPRSRQLLAPLCAEVEGLPYYACACADIAGVPCVVSRTGWSGELGYEIYPRRSDQARLVWDAIVDSGLACGLLITGPNLSRAVERGITDTHYFVNCDMNPFEAGRARLVDLDHGPFVGQEALRAAANSTQRRKTVGVVAGEKALPTLEEFWVLEDRSGPLGKVLWSAYSFALGKAAGIALVDDAVVVGTEVLIRHSGGRTQARIVDLPLAA